MLDFFPKTTPGDIWRKFLIYFPAGLLAVLMVFWMIARLENKQIPLMMVDHERSHLLQAQNLISRQLGMLTAELLALAESGNLKKHLSFSSLENLTEDLYTIAEDKKAYDRMSYLDQTGRVLAVFDRHIQETGDDRQQGQYRDLMREAPPLAQGEIAVAVTTGGEEGSPDIPDRHVLHLSTPVFDDLGQRRGILVLDCRTNRLMDRVFESFPAQEGERFLVIDNGGRQLRTLPAGKDNGDLFLAAGRSDLWRAMQNSPTGHIRTKDGLFSFTSFSPAMEMRKAAGAARQGNAGQDAPRTTDEYAWHIVLFTPLLKRSLLDIVSREANLWLLAFGLAALATGSLHLAINRANKERSDRAVALLSTAIEQSPAAAVITDKNGLIRYANPKFVAMSGYRREEIAGQNPRIFKSGETPEDVYRNLWQTISVGRVWTGEFRNRRKDGSLYIVSAKISPILQKTGTISGYLAIQEDITENRRLQQQLERLATIDGLTGTYNRCHFLQLFSQELKREERYGMPLCLLIFDLDHFKAINDTYGHQIGDKVLEECARVVDSTLRETDIFGRLGGEEFGVVLLQTDLDGARLLAERLRSAIETMRVDCEGGTIRVTVSIGGTQWDRNDRKVEVIMNRADNALYEAKRRGRNQVCFMGASEDGDRNQVENLNQHRNA